MLYNVYLPQGDFYLLVRSYICIGQVGHPFSVEMDAI